MLKSEKKGDRTAKYIIIRYIYVFASLCKFFCKHIFWKAELAFLSDFQKHIISHIYLLEHILVFKCPCRDRVKKDFLMIL